MPQLDPDDWRLAMVRGTEGFSWTLKTWRRPKPDWDHDHCAACGQKIAETDMDGEAHIAGYASGPEHPRGADYDWLCIDCAHELAAYMNWKLAGGPARS